MAFLLRMSITSASVLGSGSVGSSSLNGFAASNTFYERMCNNEEVEYVEPHDNLESYDALAEQIIDVNFDTNQLTPDEQRVFRGLLGNSVFKGRRWWNRQSKNAGVRIQKHVDWPSNNSMPI